MSLDRPHRRSLEFVDHGKRTWACFLVTFEDREGRWHGYLSFRTGDGEAGTDDVRTADIFLGGSEVEIHERARSFGRPLLSALLESALGTRDRNDAGAPGLRRRFRSMLAERSRRLGEGWDNEEQVTLGAGELRSRYASYRLDQVAHFIALIPPNDFEVAVDRILGGTGTTLDSGDRAALVVAFIEERLPLPPFEVWSRDFLTHRSDYRLYAHTLHEEGRLP